MRVEGTPAIVIHVQPYRETSALVRFLTRDMGRLSTVMRGARKNKTGMAVQTFAHGLLSAVGRGDLLTVTRFEVQAPFMLSGDGLNAGFYVLELVTRSLTDHQAEPEVFEATTNVLTLLASAQDRGDIARALRRYEHALLAALGFGVDYGWDAEKQAPVIPGGTYEYVPEFGFRACTQDQSGALEGRHLIALASGIYAGPDALRVSRTVMRQALIPLIGHKPLASRQLFRTNVTDP